MSTVQVRTGFFLSETIPPDSAQFAGGLWFNYAERRLWASHQVVGSDPATYVWTEFPVIGLSVDDVDLRIRTKLVNYDLIQGNPSFPVYLGKFPFMQGQVLMELFDGITINDIVNTTGDVQVSNSYTIPYPVNTEDARLIVAVPQVNGLLFMIDSSRTAFGLLNSLVLREDTLTINGQEYYIYLSLAGFSSFVFSEVTFNLWQTDPEV